jgi:hypothetical protein
MRYVLSACTATNLALFVTSLATGTSLEPSIDVQTVDSYQGKEGEAMVTHCSAAWKNRRNPIGFLTDIRCLNVDITLAKTIMFIVGNLSFWESRITTLPNDTSRVRSGKRKFPMKSTDGVPRILSLAREERMLVHYSNIAKKRYPQAFADLPGAVWVGVLS